MYIEKTSMINKTVLLLDIDETIFDTNRYKEELSSRLSVELGYQSPEEFFSLFKELLELTVVKRLYFDPVFFLEAAYATRKQDTTLERLDEIFWDKSLFENKLYPDVINTLESLSHKEDLVLGILSTGDRRHQGEKIGSIRHFFDESNINIFPDKIAVLEEILKKYETFRVVVIDDRTEILERIKLLNSSVKTILMCRGEKASDQDSFDRIFTDLHDILSLIN